MNEMKKILLCIILLFNALTPICANVEAKEITETIRINGEAVPNEWLDDSIYTSFSFSENEGLKITSDEKIQSIYIKYASSPTPFTMSVDDEIIQVAKNGFLHELISLKSSANEVIFNVGEIEICDIFVFTEGELPSFVQQFMLPYEKCDLLVFPTHADDDTLYFGIPMTIYADQGYRIQVAYLTNHLDTIDRPHELLDGLWEMGITAYPIISEFSDIRAMSLESAIDVYDENAVLMYQVANIRRFKPDVILGHDENGEYGHGVHMLNTYLLKQAIELSGEENAFPESAVQYGVWTPQKTYLHMYQTNTLYFDENTVLSDGLTSIQKAKNAYKKHLSQQKWVLDVIPSGEGDCRMFGLYQSQVGEDTISDLFEHIEKRDNVVQSKLMIKNYRITKERIWMNSFNQFHNFLRIMIGICLGQYEPI